MSRLLLSVGRRHIFQRMSPCVSDFHLLRMPRRALSSRNNPQAQKPQVEESTGRSDDNSEWINSDERSDHLTKTEWWILRIAVVSCTAAIAMFTWTKYEIEKRLESLPLDEQKAWRDGTYPEFKKHKERLALMAVEESSEGFNAADEFEGARPGFVFKRGAAGLGYYPDLVGEQLAALERENQ